MYLIINRCKRHGYYCIEFGDDNGGTRMTPGKCCGSWTEIKRWKLSPRQWDEIINEAHNMKEEAEKENDISI